MPCNTITRVSLSLKNANLELLKKALEGMRHTVNQSGTGLYWYNGSYEQKTGQLTVQDEKEGSLIKQKYGGELVKRNAAKYGWTVKTASANKYQIIKR